MGALATRSTRRSPGEGCACHIRRLYFITSRKLSVARTLRRTWRREVSSVCMERIGPARWCFRERMLFSSFLRRKAAKADPFVSELCELVERHYGRVRAYSPGRRNVDVRAERFLISRRRTGARLPVVFSAAGANQSGVAITTYGQGQVTGAMYTVPAHGVITVDFDLKLLCVTPQDIQNLGNRIRSLLDASHQHLYDDVQNTDVSGGASFFGFWSGGVSASFSETKRTMDAWGLSEQNQETIVNAMMKVANKTSDFKYQGTV
jgi:hypothetical protein